MIFVLTISDEEPMRNIYYAVSAKRRAEPVFFKAQLPGKKRRNSISSSDGLGPGAMHGRDVKEMSST